LRLRKTLAVLAAQLALAGGVLAVEIDGDLMRGIDDTTKSLDSDVAQKDAKAAAAAARELVDAFAKVESHYAETPATADAAGYAHKAQGHAADVVKAIAANDFDAAAEAVDKLAHSCKSCHDVYKKT
jgi:predicted lipid-binding transport protein (Tim44 family)